MQAIKVKEWDRNHDYTEEIIRCAKFIVQQMEKGWTNEEAVNQSVSSYTWYIAREAVQAIGRNTYLSQQFGITE